MKSCDCNAGLSNTGVPNCVPVQGITSSLILVPLTANDGTKNGIDLSASIPTWSDYVNEADASKRWFPLPKFENVELPKADSLFEEANSGRKAYLRQGVRSFAGELWQDDSTPTFLGKLQASRCVQFGIYIVDVEGDLIGSEVNGILYPIPVDNDSWDPKFMFATDATVQKIMLGFDFYRLFDESTMKMITAEESGIDFNSLEGLLDVELTVASATTTAITVSANLDYGTAYNPILYKGATASSDWLLENVDAGATVTIDAVTEGPDGTYIVDYTSAGLASGVNLKLSVAKTGFEGSVNTVTA
jgi:hypothetical protein